MNGNLNVNIKIEKYKLYESRKKYYDKFYSKQKRD